MVVALEMTDRGPGCRSRKLNNLLEGRGHLGDVRSMSCKGHSSGNAVCEAFFGN